MIVRAMIGRAVRRRIALAGFAAGWCAGMLLRIALEIIL